jgi:hypothetical protein
MQRSSYHPFYIKTKNVNLFQIQDMDTAAMLQEIHNYLEVVEDKKVKAIYTMMEESIKESAVDY